MKIHIVQPNETLTAIAAQHGVELEPLLKFNPNLQPHQPLEVGQKIKVPSSGVKVLKTQTSEKGSEEKNNPLPKWWYEEAKPETVPAGSTLQDSDTTLQDESQSYGTYPALDPTQYPAAYPAAYPTAYPLHQTTASAPNWTYSPTIQAPYANPYNGYLANFIQPLQYAYAAAASAWYDPVMTILASNRIPIPPRRQSLAKMGYGKLPSSFFQVEDWSEDWEEQEQENKE